jgi:lipopolysaccharide export system permease protein
VRRIAASSGGIVILLRTVDKYLMGRVALGYAAVIVAVVAILSLENVARLSGDIQRTDAPLRLLARLPLVLVPEHLGIAIPMAAYLAMAVTARQLALRGEWQIFAATGLRPARIMAAPMALAALAATVQLALLLELRPIGARSLDALYAEIGGGLHGTPLVLGETVRLDATTSFFAEARSRATPGAITNVLVGRGPDVFAAPLAVVTSGSHGAVTLDLRDGTIVHRAPDGAHHSVRFAHYLLQVRPPNLGVIRGNLRHRLDRLEAPQLLRLAGRDADGQGGQAAAAAMAARVEGALFCLLLPWLGLALGTPPRRGNGGAGMFLGIALIAAHFRSAAFVEDNFAGAPLVAVGAHFLLWTGATITVLSFTRSHGDGAMDTLIARLFSAPAGLAHRLRQAFRHRDDRRPALAALTDRPA